MRIGLIFSIALLANCSWMGFNDEESTESEESGYTERGFYDKIQSSLKSRNWQIAIANLQLLESQFPFGKYAEQSQLELIYAQCCECFSCCTYISCAVVKVKKTIKQTAALIDFTQTFNVDGIVDIGMLWM